MALTSKFYQVCSFALLTLIFEMYGSMYTLLPKVFLDFSKISAKVPIAIPLQCSPSSITNPFKLNLVTYAYLVIIMWPVKRRLVNRKILSSSSSKILAVTYSRSSQ